MQALTQFRAQLPNGAEGPDGEVNIRVDVSEVGQLDPQRLVHWCEVDDGVGRDVVLVQRPARLVKPRVLLGPPHGMVGPVHCNVCKRKKIEVILIAFAGYHTKRSKSK